MEAAIVLPIIILVIITVVLIVLFFYMQVHEQCSMHRFLRAQAASMTENTIYVDRDKLEWDGSVDIKEQVFGGTVYGKGYLIMANKGVLFRKGAYVVEGASHMVDGTKYVRYCTLIKGTVPDEE